MCLFNYIFFLTSALLPLCSFLSLGTAAALLEAARAASTATGIWAGEAPAPQREHWQSGSSAQEGPGPQGSGGAETSQQWQTGWVLWLWIHNWMPAKSMVWTMEVSNLIGLRCAIFLWLTVNIIVFVSLCILSSYLCHHRTQSLSLFSGGDRANE